MDFVATEMGRGSILTMSTSSPGMPVTHILPPLSIMHKWADALKSSTANAERLTQAYTIVAMEAKDVQEANILLYAIQRYLWAKQ